MKKAVMCIVPRQDDAESIVKQLQTVGFTPRDISVLFPDKSGTTEFAHHHDTRAPEGAVLGASTGSVVGGALGLLAGIGALAIPGIGPFIAAGPLMAALGGAALGSAVLGITGALIGMGIPEVEARKYEAKIKSGNILIAVHTDSREQREAAEGVYKAANADDISAVAETSVPIEQPASAR